MELRRALPADAPRLQYVAELGYATYLTRMAGLLPGPLRTDYAAAVADTEAWVASVDGVVVGFLLLVEEEDGLLFDNVAVLPSHHGQGIGRALLVLAEQRALAAGRTRIRLYTHVTMVENQRLYALSVLDARAERASRPRQLQLPEVATEQSRGQRPRSTPVLSGSAPDGPQRHARDAR